MHINQDFDGGNIELISASSAADIRLAIRKDQDSDFYQWFYFRLHGEAGHRHCLKIVNAGGASYPAGFDDYRVLYSYDRAEWRRAPTRLADGTLHIELVPDHASVWFAYFVPYPMERHHELIGRAQRSPRCVHRVLGETIDGQDLDLLRISADSSGAGNGGAGKKQCWIIARQHPGETMAEWWMEGCIDKLLAADDAMSAALLELADVHLVPNMNPDGSRRGHLRTNAVGRNLNREWAAPDAEASPEVYLVQGAMAATGVDFFLDVHGDEALPYCFIAGAEGIAGWGDKEQGQLDFYKNTLAELNPDFQTAKGYPVAPPGQANLAMATPHTAARYGCLAMTLEMPFKDAADTPDPVYGWSAARCRRLAASCLQTLVAYLGSDP